MLQASRTESSEAAARCRPSRWSRRRSGSCIPSPPCASASWRWSSRSAFRIAPPAARRTVLHRWKRSPGRPWPWRDSARRSWRSRRWHVDDGRPVHPDRRHRGPHRGSRTTLASVSRTPARRQSKPGGHSVYEFASASRRSTAASRVSSRRSAPSRRRRGRCRRAPAWTGSNPSGHQVSRSARAPDRFARVMSARPRSAPRRSTPCNRARHSRQSPQKGRVRRR